MDMLVLGNGDRASRGKTRHDGERMAGRGLALVVFTALAAACSFDSSGLAGGDGGAASDAMADAAPPDAVVTRGEHVLLTEIKTGPDTLEFIEIYNPTCVEVALGDYYLSDDPAYSLLPSWGDPRPDLGEVDAVVRFPPGAVLAPRAVAVVARSGTAFETGFGRAPDYALTSPGGAAEMVFIAHGDQPNLTISADGEPVTLFTWDGADDLVKDVDVVIAGEAPVAGHQLVPKQVLSPEGVDGPDGDATASRYRDDEATLPVMEARDANSGSYARIVFEDVFEIADGGNGVVGHDETSEDTRITWEQDVGSSPTPGEIGASLEVDCSGRGP
jgi:hypothetical protein